MHTEPHTKHEKEQGVKEESGPEILEKMGVRLARGRELRGLEMAGVVVLACWLLECASAFSFSGPGSFAFSSERRALVKRTCTGHQQAVAPALCGEKPGWGKPRLGQRESSFNMISDVAISGNTALGAALLSVGAAYLGQFFIPERKEVALPCPFLSVTQCLLASKSQLSCRTAVSPSRHAAHAEPFFSLLRPGGGRSLLPAPGNVPAHGPWRPAHAHHRSLGRGRARRCFLSPILRSNPLPHPPAFTPPLTPRISSTSMWVFRRTHPAAG